MSEPAPQPPDAGAGFPDLEFPVAPDFVSHPPRLDPQVMLRRCAGTMPWRNAPPGERERRRAQMIDVEFVL